MKNNAQSWGESLKFFLKPSSITMLFLGFSAGLPIYLIFSSLSLWLREAGVERASVTFFSWAALGYSFKFIWAPLVDTLPIPWLTNKMGRRRSWMLLSQFMIMGSIIMMGLVDPASSERALVWMAVAAVLLGFSAATQDIVIDAFRIESDIPSLQAALSATYIAGYRIGMIVAGAGALVLAVQLGSTKEAYSYNAWMWTYIFMGLLMLVGVATTLLANEPKPKGLKENKYKASEYRDIFVLFLIMAATFATTFFFCGQALLGVKTQLSLLTGKGLSQFIFEAFKLVVAIGVVTVVVKLILKTKFINKKIVNETFVAPALDFFNRYGNSLAFLILALVGLYRISDIVLGVISNVFYLDLGFTKLQIAGVVKSFGLIMTIVGGFLGGLMTIRYGVMKILFLGAVLSAATNVLFMFLANMGNDMTFLYIVISADNLSAGLASAAFVAFLSSLTNVSFTAVQYAIFTSLMTLLPKAIGGYSGTLVDSMGYSQFFAFTAILGVPVLVLIWLAGKRFDIKEQ